MICFWSNVPLNMDYFKLFSPQRNGNKWKIQSLLYTIVYKILYSKPKLLSKWNKSLKTAIAYQCLSLKLHNKPIFKLIQKFSLQNCRGWFYTPESDICTLVSYFICTIQCIKVRKNGAQQPPNSWKIAYGNTHSDRTVSILTEVLHRLMYGNVA